MEGMITGIDILFVLIARSVQLMLLTAALLAIGRTDGRKRKVLAALLVAWVAVALLLFWSL